jgi:hypothetical protein
MSYYDDHRVRAGEREEVFTDIDEQNMTCTMRLEYEEPVEVKFRWTVCPTCDGKGSHVNPSIDCDGLTASDFEDEEFKESYFSGVYDVVCAECNGNRVVPELIDPEDIKMLNEYHSEMWEYEAERAAERRMGA